MRSLAITLSTLALAAVACASDPAAPPSSAARDQGGEVTERALARAGLLWPIACVPGETCDG